MVLMMLRALRSCDVGISVDEGTDIAKESSDIILLEQNLEVIHNGVIEGRTVYGNILKYMKLALSQDFGDVFSILIASIFLPFLPLLPIQMLIQDFIVELSQIGIPYDNVDVFGILVCIKIQFIKSSSILPNCLVC